VHYLHPIFQNNNGDNGNSGNGNDEEISGAVAIQLSLFI